VLSDELRQNRFLDGRGPDLGAARPRRGAPLHVSTAWAWVMQWLELDASELIIIYCLRVPDCTCKLQQTGQAAASSQLRFCLGEGVSPRCPSIGKPARPSAPLLFFFYLFGSVLGRR
jgi:hypothetical protein